jgi:uncharacterized protein YdeI (YjbR/CyaY-like superfamily)
MAKTKHNPEASHLIDEYIESLPDFSKEICTQLRQIVLKTDKEIIEDWKWGPNYFHHGMVCGFGAFKEHVSFVFFQGAILKDEHQILKMNAGNLHNRHIKFKNAKEIKPRIITAYLKEAIDNNMKGEKILVRKEKVVTITDVMRSSLKKVKLLDYFESLSYTHRKEYAEWINSAKREQTIIDRMEKMIEMLQKKKASDQGKKLK